jgi:hypothetical protein
MAELGLKSDLVMQAVNISCSIGKRSQKWLAFQELSSGAEKYLVGYGGLGVFLSVLSFPREHQ